MVRSRSEEKLLFPSPVPGSAGGLRGRRVLALGCLEAPAPGRGRVLVAGTDRGIWRISIHLEPFDLSQWKASLQRRARENGTPLVVQEGGSLVDGFVKELEAYFRGSLRRFRTPPDLEGQGTPFQRRVWEALREIPYGETRSYREVACRVGSPRGPRAVGQASGRNPVPILVPCHRVIDSRGGLGGYTGGLEVKRLLLRIEGFDVF